MKLNRDAESHVYIFSLILVLFGNIFHSVDTFRIETRIGPDRAVYCIKGPLELGEFHYKNCGVWSRRGWSAVATRTVDFSFFFS